MISTLGNNFSKQHFDIFFSLFLPPKYGRCPKISNTFKYFFGLNFLHFMQLLLKILSDMANSVDPDQTAPDLGLHCLHMPFCLTLWCMKL